MSSMDYKEIYRRPCAIHCYSDKHINSFWIVSFHSEMRYGDTNPEELSHHLIRMTYPTNNNNNTCMHLYSRTKSKKAKL